MVGHQNWTERLQSLGESLGRQGMVGHQNPRGQPAQGGTEFRPSGNGRPPKQVPQANTGTSSLGRQGMVGHQNVACSQAVLDRSLGRQGMVGHQNCVTIRQAQTRSLGRQGMVGHQNKAARVPRVEVSLGRQGMVGHQNRANSSSPELMKFRPSGNGRPPKPRDSCSSGEISV